MESLLMTTVLSLSNSSSWISSESWKCIETIANSYFHQEAMLILSENDIFVELPPRWSFYTSSSKIPPKHRHFDTVMIFKDITKWTGSDLRGRVVVVTESLEGALDIWTRFLLLNVIFLVQKSTRIEVYSWFPYDHRYCQEDNRLMLLDTWQNNGFTVGANLFPNKVPTNFRGCPLRILLSGCSPYIQWDDARKLSLNGPEMEVARDLASAYNATIRVVRARGVGNYHEFFYPNNSFGGSLRWLWERRADVGGACIYVSLDKIWLFEFLPSHYTDALVWILPGPVKESVGNGLFKGLTAQLWMAVGVTFVASILICRFIAPCHDYGTSFSWAISRIMGLSYYLHNSHFILNLIEVILDLGALIITSTYRSGLLVNLFFVPYEQFSTPEEGIEAGLITHYRFIFYNLYNQTNHALWNSIFRPGKHVVEEHFNVSLIIEDRSAMALILKYVDQADIQKTYPGQPYYRLVTELKEPYARMDMAMFMPPSHPLRRVMYSKMFYIIESGLPTHYLKKQLRQNELGAEDINDNVGVQKIQMIHLTTTFLLLGFLLTVSFVVFILELFYFKIVQCKSARQKTGFRQSHLNRMRHY